MSRRSSCTSSASEWVLVAALVVSVGCSSSENQRMTTLDASSADGGLTDAGSAAPCRPDPALTPLREACRFDSGARVVDTIGACTGSAIPIEHVVILMQENRSFDQYFGHLKGHGQDDVEVAPEGTTNPTGDGGVVPWHHETAYCVQDTDHTWAASHAQYDDGKNDGFARSNVKPEDPDGARAMGYYDASDLPFYYDLAAQFAISDRYFASVLGPTYPNRLFLYAGTSFGSVSTDADGFAPSGAAMVLRQFDERGISWKVYKTNLASAQLFSDYAGDPVRADRFVPVEQFAIDAAAGLLPQVSFVEPNLLDKAYVETDEHPPADIQLGQHWVYDKVHALITSPLWRSSALFITYDEHGGLYDHVPPPRACVPDAIPPRKETNVGGFDRLGFRVPVFVVSPYAKRHFVSHEVHSHASVLRFLQAKFELAALTARDANADAMLDFFDFEHPNFDVPTLLEPAVNPAELSRCMTAFP